MQNRSGVIPLASFGARGRTFDSKLSLRPESSCRGNYSLGVGDARQPMNKHAIFYDPTGRRARRVSLAGWTLSIVSSLLCAAFVASLLIVPSLPDMTFAGARKTSTQRLAAPGLAKLAAALADEARAKQRGVPRATYPAVMNVAYPSSPPAKPATQARAAPLTIGFYANWDDSSYSSLKHRLGDLDWVVPTWLSLAGADMALHVDIDRKALDFIRRTKPQTTILPLLQNSTEGVWNGAGLARLLADPDQRRARLNQIAAFIAANQFQGLMVDFEAVPPAAQKDLQVFVGELAAAFAPHGWHLAIAAPFDDDDWDYRAYAKLTNFVVLMAYDEHWEEGTAGPVASQSWFEDKLAKRMTQLDPAHTIVALGSYGYDWVKGAEATELSFQEAVLSARESEADIAFDEDRLNPHFSYVEDDGKVHDVWFLDGVTIYNQIHAADAYAPAGYALWRLGSEDPSIWSVLGIADRMSARANLANIAVGQDIDFEGNGEILRIVAKPAPGTRRYDVDPDSGLITDETYTQLPASYVIQRLGNVPGEVALTFDDGPDPVWTPQILDILKAKGVHASFFIIGENAEAYPDLVARMVAEGHDVGNHTFTHPNLGEAPQSLSEIELNATQRLFGAITGRSMRLFRPPYFGDAEPTTRDEVLPIEIAQAMGYVTVGLLVDPDDWQLPPADEIIRSVTAQLASDNPEERGQVVLLHDAGGDRSRTVAALGPLIDKLRAKGYTFVPVRDLAGLTADQAMPKLPPDALEYAVDTPMFFLLGRIGHALHALLVATIALGVARLVFLVVFALKNRRDESLRQPPAEDADRPLLSVLIPAFNEARVIAASIDRVLASDYRNLEVIVVDDGSSDGTSAVVRARFASEPRVALLTIPNGGKARAINTGLQRAKGDIVIALDADTQFERRTISNLARWFADPNVGAVAGNAKVGNRVNMITRWQALEYITAQNLERRALAGLGCITVVPGAVGAWRRSTLEALGGFPSDTLAEDQDLTLAVQKAGYRVLFDADAIAWTEAPDTVKGLARQRFRWAYGTLQCLWKHADAALRPRYRALGLIALPQVLLFQIALAALSPLIDLLLVWQVAVTALDYFQHGAAANAGNLMEMEGYYALFLAIDLGAGAFAFALEKGEQWRLLWWLALQRFGYRQLMYYVVVKSLAVALSGAIVGWGRLERKATVAPLPHAAE